MCFLLYLSFFTILFVQKVDYKIFFKKLLTHNTLYDIIYYVGADDAEGTPVPISNTVVKLGDAEDTWSVTTWENKVVPTFFVFIFNLPQADLFFYKKTIDFYFFIRYNLIRWC